MSRNRVQIFETPADLSGAAAAAIAAKLASIQAGAPRAAIVLAGGSTPEAAYRTLAEPRLSRAIAWDRLDLFWGDERAVPPDHPSSNYGMARRALLDRVPAPPDRVHRIQAQLDPAEAARRYEDEIRSAFPGVAVPRLDLVLLGLGEDGHTASLFPGAMPEGDVLVAAPFVPRLAAHRITATLRLLAAAADLVFLVSGPAKASALARVLEDPACDLPAARVARAHGSCTWLVDREAAARLARA